MGFPWVFHGFSMGFPWVFHGFSMGFPWVFHGFSMGFPWVFHGFSMGFPWVFHGFSMGFPWVFHGFSMGFPWVFHRFSGASPFLSLAVLNACCEKETGWKLVHGDVFRKPRFGKLLAVSVGSGVAWRQKDTEIDHRQITKINRIC